MLETFLPCEKQVKTSVWNPLGKVARDIDDMEQTEPVVVAAAKDAPVLTAFPDGAHIQCRPEVQKRHLNVVVGKIESYDKCCRVSLLKQVIFSPASQLRKYFRTLGWDHRQTVTVISDGEPALPNLVRAGVGGKIRRLFD